MKYVLIEFNKFLKKNILKITVGALVITAILIGADFILTSNEVNQEDDFVNEFSNENINFEARPATFQFYVEYPDGSAFSNEDLISQYVMNPEVLEEASLVTNTNLLAIINETENESIIENDQLLDLIPENSLKTLGISRNRDSHVIRFYVNVGNESQNQEIADYFYEYIFTDGMPFLEDKSVYLFQEPQILQLEETEEVNLEQGNNWQSLIILSLLAVIFGLVLMTGIFLIVSFFSKKLHYFYTYSLKDSDYFILVDDKLDNKDEWNQLIRKSLDQDFVIVDEYKDTSLLSEIPIKTSNIVSNIYDYGELKEIEGIIYIVNEGSTTREWYNKQRKFDRIIQTPIIVVQINKSL